MRKGFFYILLFFFIQGLYSQGPSIKGVVNSYYKVNSIDVAGTYVQVDASENLDDLHPGDKVILMQMTGVDVGSTITNDPPINSIRNAGRYEMLAVKSVNNILKRVEFTVTLNTSYYTNGEKFQLVKIYEADYVTVDSTLTADDWDSTMNKGGVVALVIYKKLTLNANIDVSNKGFRGGEPELLLIDTCHTSDDTLSFPSGTLHRAGRKGEGNVEASWIYTKGPAMNATGGGGGLGCFAGGGGGSHYRYGGQGGIQRQSCPVLRSASGGYNLENYNFYTYGRVTMGGGGGSSTEIAGRPGTKGGNGGGIVLLLVDTLTGTGSINSKGEDVTGPVAVGGSGGGAGGSILLDVNVYASAANTLVSVRGGNGGITNTYTGAGGGGSGGVIWYAQPARPSKITPDTLRGSRGTSTTGDNSYYGGWGGYGGEIKNLELPLNGFLFNSINGVDTICAGQSPNIITGSMPKGGSGSYSHSWQYRLNGGDWSDADTMGTEGLLYFMSYPLTQTTYFRRLVTSADVTDTSLMVEVFVYPAITGNTLAIRDTLCDGSIPGTLIAGTLGGGDSLNYEYQWQSSADQVDWDNRGTGSTLNESNQLHTTTYYRRIVTSAVVCTSTSNIDTITILPSITNYEFDDAETASDTAICANLDGGIIHGDQPGGGDGIYSYQWLFSSDNSDYNEIIGETGQNYSPPDNLTGGLYYYKRVVYSGEGNACDNTSGAYSIVVYPSITFNNISTDSSRYCYNNFIAAIEGEQPGGGNAGNYIYRWFDREPGESWALIDGVSGMSYTPQGNFTDTTQIRRVVLSGSYNACIDSSNMIQIDVIPQIFNTLVSDDTALCEGATPLGFIESPASGGAGGLIYLWQSRPLGGTWEAALPVNNTVSYNSGSLTQTTEFRRTVQSQICISNSSPPITITVYPSIENNIIEGSSIQYTCYNSEKELTGGDISGGNQNDIRFNWQQSLLGTTWDPATGVNTAIDYTSVPLTDTMFYRRVVLSGAYNQCMDTSTSVLVRINPLPSGNIVSSVDTVCSGSDLTVDYENLLGNSPWSIILGLSDDNPLDTTKVTVTSGEISFQVTQSGQIQMLYLIDDSLCYADLRGNTDIVELTVFELPDAEAGDTIKVCGLETTMAAIPSVGVGNWSGSGATFGNPSLATSGVTASAYGIYNFEWTEMNWQCPSTDEVEVTFYEQPVTPNAGEDQLLDYTFTATLDAEPPAVGYGYWQFTGDSVNFDDPTQYNTGVTIPYPATGEYVLLWTVINGVCPAVSATVTLTVEPVNIAHGFSPNGDQINETFLIKLSGKEDVLCHLIILDRWGNRVYHTDGWDVLSWSGEDVPEGTYFYIFTVDRHPGQNKQGYIELRR